jgi:hypothetical protein
LEDLITAEQFHQILPEGMAVWVKDRKPANLERMAELADDYMLSRRGVGQVGDSSSGRSDGTVVVLLVVVVGMVGGVIVALEEV